MSSARTSLAAWAKCSSAAWGSGSGSVRTCAPNRARKARHSASGGAGTASYGTSGSARTNVSCTRRRPVPSIRGASAPTSSAASLSTGMLSAAMPSRATRSISKCLSQIPGWNRNGWCPVTRRSSEGPNVDVGRSRRCAYRTAACEMSLRARRRISASRTPAMVSGASSSSAAFCRARAASCRAGGTQSASPDFCGISNSIAVTRSVIPDSPDAGSRKRETVTAKSCFPIPDSRFRHLAFTRIGQARSTRFSPGRRTAPRTRGR